MQSMYLHHRMKSFVVTVIMGIIFFSLCSHVLALDLSMAGALQLKKDFGPAVQMDETLMTVHVPLNISKMPGAWKNAEGKLKVAVVF